MLGKASSNVYLKSFLLFVFFCSAKFVERRSSKIPWRVAGGKAGRWESGEERRLVLAIFIAKEVAR